jgi:outer membrane protein OmpA-like peptidoglycan-associated protein
MHRKIHLMMSAAVLGGFALAAPAQAAPHGVKMGVLTCHVASGWGYIIASSRDLECSYRPNRGEADHYVGSISKLGVDIGYTQDGVLIWDVVAPSSDTRAGALQGDYAGATASATIGAGIGANVLIGGFDKSIALQPVSFEGNVGFNVAAGIGEISLRAAHPAQVSEEPRPYREAEIPPPAPTTAKTFAVFFSFDKSNLTPEARQIVHEAVLAAKDMAPVRVIVVGDTDTVGTHRYNQRLSEARANAVRKEMLQQGMEGVQIAAVGRSFDDPLIPTGPATREARNRRAIIEVQSSTGA